MAKTLNVTNRLAMITYTKPGMPASAGRPSWNEYAPRIEKIPIHGAMPAMQPKMNGFQSIGRPAARRPSFWVSTSHPNRFIDTFAAAIATRAGNSVMKLR